MVGARDHDEHGVRGRFFQGLQEGVGAVGVQGLRALDDANLVAAAIALECQGFDEVAYLVDLDLLRILLEAHGMHIGMRVGAEPPARRTNLARTRARRLAQRQRGNPIRQLVSAQPRHAQQQQRMRQPTGAERRPHALLRLIEPRQSIGTQEIHDRTVSCRRICAPTSSTGRAASMTMILFGSAAARARYTLLTLSKNSPLSRSKRSATVPPLRAAARAKACSTPASNRMVRSGRRAPCTMLSNSAMGATPNRRPPP